MPASLVDFSTLANDDLFTLPTDTPKVVYRRIDSTHYIRHYPVTVVTDAGSDTDGGGTGRVTVGGALNVYSTNLTVEAQKMIDNGSVATGHTWVSRYNATNYDIVAVSIHTETTQPLVTYTKTTPGGDARNWSRPLMAFLAEFDFVS